MRTGFGDPGDNEERWNSLPPLASPGRTIAAAAWHGQYNRVGDKTRLSTLANDDWRYIADPNDRATAMLQYRFRDRALIVRVAINLGAGYDPFDGVTRAGAFVQRLTELHEPGRYAEHDYRADLLAAATRLITRVAEDRDLRPVVYRGVPMPYSYDLLSAYATGTIEGGVPGDFWSFAAVSPVLEEAGHYGTREGHVAVVYEIHNPRGAPLSPVGRMFQSKEGIVNGQICILRAHPSPDGRAIRVVAKWVNSRFPMTT